MRTIYIVRKHTSQNISILRQSSHLHSGVSDDCERRAWPLQRQRRLTRLGLWQRVHVRRCTFFHFSTLACALFGSLLTGTDNCEVLHAMGFKKVMGSDYSPQAVSLALVSSPPSYLVLFLLLLLCAPVCCKFVSLSFVDCNFEHFTESLVHHAGGAGAFSRDKKCSIR